MILVTVMTVLMKYEYMFSFDQFLHVNDINSRDAFAEGVLFKNTA